MKANRITTLARVTGMTIALALFAGVSGQLYAQNGAKGGATKLLELSGGAITSQAEASNDKPMSCAKCKDEFVQRVDRSARGANKPVITVTTHLCNGCGTDWNVVGHGKAQVSVATHKCTSCGAATVACCNPKTARETATKGMDKKFEVAPIK
jgi:hypothetical protein